ncbi:Rossmann-like and DUF2520 domain-containing protein [Chitinimonas sp.]|uniref:Rossmann-like and DUF2520 domain-containing protein n=1 Tax=Chitinimonas sp. TaxID=1934313 RepID=UPI0035ADE869
MSLPVLNLIGPGKLGLSLVRLWQAANTVILGDVVGRDRHKSAAIATTLGARACQIDELAPADFTLIATPDTHLAHVAAQLAAAGTLRPGSVVFHCSGALPSAVLAPLRAAGALLASVHPLKSFASDAVSAGEFSGSYCGCEGDAEALARLAPLFDALGARRFAIDADHKTLYHAGAVLACNKLVALMECALRSMAAAGVPRDIAWPALRPLIDGTLINLDRLSPAQALTGPIARGDAVTVDRQQGALADLDPSVATVYRSLGEVAVQLTNLDETQRQSLRAALEAQA